MKKSALTEDFTQLERGAGWDGRLRVALRTAEEVAKETTNWLKPNS